MRNFDAFQFDGRAALASVIASSEYGSLEQAVASLALFAHPHTVMQTRGLNIFRVVRARSREDRGTYVELATGDTVMRDDNSAPTNAFAWVHDLRRQGQKLRDVQFNHLWPRSSDVSAYTNLTNLCMMPAFLSKLSDTDSTVCALLRFRAWQLYAGCLGSNTVPERLPSYDELRWAETLPPVNNVEAIYRAAMRKRQADRTTCSARELGWLFSEFQPDPSV
jgi:hypothetical protein